LYYYMALFITVTIVIIIVKTLVNYFKDGDQINIVLVLEWSFDKIIK